MADDSRREIAAFVRVEKKRHSTVSSDSSDDDGRMDAPLVKQCRSSGDITVIPKRITIKDSVEDLESAYLESAQLSHLTEELSYVYLEWSDRMIFEIFVIWLRKKLGFILRSSPLNGNYKIHVFFIGHSRWLRYHRIPVTLHRISPPSSNRIRSIISGEIPFRCHY